MKIMIVLAAHLSVPQNSCCFPKELHQWECYRYWQNCAQDKTSYIAKLLDEKFFVVYYFVACQFILLQLTDFKLSICIRVIIKRQSIFFFNINATSLKDKRLNYYGLGA